MHFKKNLGYQFFTMGVSQSWNIFGLYLPLQWCINIWKIIDVLAISLMSQSKYQVHDKKI